MYISQVEIDTDDRKRIRELSHLGAVHNWVESSFPEEFASSARSRKLWRIDRLKGKQYLLIVSPEAPDLKSLERYGVTGTASTKSYTPFLETFKADQRARFRVTLNPVIAVKEERGERGRVMPHVTVAQQKQFLLDRSQSNGFMISDEEFDITERTYLPLKKGGMRAINLSKVTYEGILTVTDVEKIKRTLTSGFGKKKAYGFGLMTIIPLESHG